MSLEKNLKEFEDLIDSSSNYTTITILSYGFYVQSFQEGAQVDHNTAGYVDIQMVYSNIGKIPPDFDIISHLKKKRIIFNEEIQKNFKLPMTRFTNKYKTTIDVRKY